jgi:hypothetical protein
VVNSVNAFRPKALPLTANTGHCSSLRKTRVLPWLSSSAWVWEIIEVNYLLLLTIYPRGQHQKEQLPRLQNEGHGWLHQ